MPPCCKRASHWWTRHGGVWEAPSSCSIINLFLWMSHCSALLSISSPLFLIILFFGPPFALPPPTLLPFKLCPKSQLVHGWEPFGTLFFRTLPYFSFFPLTFHLFQLLPSVCPLFFMERDREYRTFTVKTVF